MSTFQLIYAFDITSKVLISNPANQTMVFKFINNFSLTIFYKGNYFILSSNSQNTFSKIIILKKHLSNCRIGRSSFSLQIQFYQTYIKRLLLVSTFSSKRKLLIYKIIPTLKILLILDAYKLYFQAANSNALTKTNQIFKQLLLPL